jgi:hypothetical protein
MGNYKEKLPACCPQPKACCRELQQQNGQRSMLAVFPPGAAG